MNKQEIITRVVTHLAQQGAQSFDNNASIDGYSGGCAYRGVNSTKCAIGCLILDQFYRLEIEGARATSARVRKCLIQSGVLEESLTEEQLDDKLIFLVSLQRIHDANRPRYWKKAFTELAQEHGLEMPEVDWSKC